MIRSKGEAGTGNIVEAVRHMREITTGIRTLGVLGPEELAATAKELRSPVDVVREVASAGRLPVPLFCAGGIATPADAALMMQLGAEGNFVGSGIFKSEDPERRARAIVEATTHFADPERVAAASVELGEPMRGRRHRRARRGGRAAPATRLVTSPTERTRTEHVALASSPQGDFEAHARALASLGAEPVEVQGPGAARGPRRARDPGRRVDDDHEGARARRARRCDSRVRRRRRRAAWHLRRDDRARPAHLGLLDIEAERNAFGRQRQSFEHDLEVEGLGPEPLRAVFIRAPWVADHGSGVEVLATYEGHPVVVREGRCSPARFTRSSPTTRACTRSSWRSRRRAGRP